MLRVAGYSLVVLGISHTVVAFVLYRQELARWFGQGLLSGAQLQGDRLPALWFLIFSATLFLLGQLVFYAAKAGDQKLLHLVAWYTLGIGALGIVALPKSPFWAAIVIAGLLFAAIRT